MILNFDADAVRKLIEIAKAAETRIPILEQVVEPQYWRKDLPAERLEMLRADAAANGGYSFYATSADVDPDLILPGLHLVGDRGVYLMANARLKGGDPQELPVVYAQEVNPETMAFDDWWEAKRRSFGGDDGIEYLPLADVEAVLSGPVLQLDCTPSATMILQGGPDLEHDGSPEI